MGCGAVDMRQTAEYPAVSILFSVLFSPGSHMRPDLSEGRVLGQRSPRLGLLGSQA